MTLPDPYANQPEARLARRRRNVALGLALVAFVLIVFFVTIARLGGGAVPHP